MTRIFIVKGETRTVGSVTGSFAYEVTNLGNMSWDVNTPASPMPLPEESHKENILVKMEGNSAQMSLSWTLLADDVTHFGALRLPTDNVNGAFAADTVTRNVFEEMEIFKEQFIPENIQDAYGIWLLNDDLSLVSGEPEDGTIAQMRFSVDGQSPVTWNVNMTYLVGNVIAMFEADVPEPPSKAIITDEAGTGKMKVLWKPYDGYASSSDAVTITGVFIQYKKQGGGLWTDVTPSMTDAVNGGSADADKLGCEDCTTALSVVSTLTGGWNHRVITLPLDEDSGGNPITTNFRIKISLSGSVTGDSGVRHKISGKTASGNVVLAVT
jgi:hypothetical protein